MGVEEAFCMKGGSGETSYVQNSVIQRAIIGEVKSMLEESIRAIFSGESPPPECLTIADLGCSTGPNTLAVLQTIVSVAASTCRSSGLRIPEFNVLMNDLPQNDFNTVFQSLPSFYKKMEEEQGVEVSCFISGTPGSFHGRLFPTKSLHFVHSSTCLHFLSQVPQGLEGLNKGSTYARKGSPSEVLNAYKERFGEDFTTFLRCRSKEIVDGGRLLLSFPCTYDDEALPLTELVNHALNQLASQGKTDKEKLNTFNVPMYMPTIQQVKELIEVEGSFIIHKDETFTVTFGAAIRSIDAGVDTSQAGNTPSLSKGAKFITNTLRAGGESFMVSQFGEEVVNALFCLVEEMVIDALADGEDFGIMNLALSLVNKG